MINLKEESFSVQSLKDEFTQRIAETERKAQLSCKERDIAKKVFFFRFIFNHINIIILQISSCCFEILNEMFHEHDIDYFYTGHISRHQEIKGLREELASRLNSNETLELIKEKEEQIRELLEEGDTV